MNYFFWFRLFLFRSPLLKESSLNRARKSYGIDPKPSDLSMSRLKLE